MFIDIKFVIVFNRIGHDKDIFFGGGGLCRRRRSFGWFSLVYVGALMGQYGTGLYLNKSCFSGPVGFPWVIDGPTNAAAILSRLLWFLHGLMFMVLGHFWHTIPWMMLSSSNFQVLVGEQWV